MGGRHVSVDAERAPQPAGSLYWALLALSAAATRLSSANQQQLTKIV